MDFTRLKLHFYVLCFLGVLSNTSYGYMAPDDLVRKWEGHWPRSFLPSLQRISNCTTYHQRLRNARKDKRSASGKLTEGTCKHYARCSELALGLKTLEDKNLKLSKEELEKSSIARRCDNDNTVIKCAVYEGRLFFQTKNIEWLENSHLKGQCSSSSNPPPPSTGSSHPPPPSTGSSHPPPPSTGSSHGNEFFE